MPVCPSDAELRRFLALELSENTALAAHLSKCSTCEATLARLSDDAHVVAWRQLLDVDAATNRLTPELLARIRQVPLPIVRSDAVVEQKAVPAIPGFVDLEELGRGGMGVVYKARYVPLNRLVALKVMNPSADEETDAIWRFQLEAHACARFQHPNIVQIFDIGEYAGQRYLSLEYVDGPSLHSVASGKPLPNRRAAALVETLARAVQYAHEHMILHRDLKPANVLLAADGTPKLADFGLVRSLSADSGLTQTGVVMGTPSYMAPEQAGAHPDVGPAVDIYGLGAILYELLTGRPPFRANTSWETLQQVIHVDPTPPSRLNPRVSRDLETICLKALAKDPKQRYESAQALADDLHRFNAGEPISARRESWSAWTWRRLRRRPLTSAAILIFLLTVGPATVALVQIHASWQLANLVGTIDDLGRAIQTQDFQSGDVEQFAAAVTELDRLDSSKAVASRQRFAELVRDRFTRPMDDADHERIDAALQTVAESDRGLADALRKELADRRHRWEPVFELTGPEFATLDSVFDPRTVRKDGTKLSRIAATGQNPLLLTRVPSGENVELSAVFAEPSWQTAAEIRLVLNAGTTGGYEFVLKAKPPLANDTARPDARLADNLAGAVRAQLVRAGKVLAEGVIGALPRGETLRLSAKREHDQLTFRVNDRIGLTFQDLFPAAGTSPGVFGVYWPAGVPLTSLRAMRRTLAARASPLERGDELYSRGKYIDALEEYRKLPAGSAESRCKEGLCLVRSGQAAEAATVLAPLAAEAGSPWPHLARCGLWLAYMRLGKLRDADAVLEVLQRGTPLEELALLIPADLIQEVWQTLFQKYAGLNAIRFDASNVGRLEKLVAVAERLQFPPRDRALIRMSLSFAYRWQNRPADALRIMEEILQHDEETGYLQAMQLTPVREACWLLRELRQADRALEIINTRLASNRDANVSLCLERARIHAARKEWSQAEMAVAEFFRLVPLERMRYPIYSTAWLIRGFIHEQQGRTNDAVNAWREGLFKTYMARVVPPHPDDDILSAFEAGMCVMNGLMLGSLAGDFSKADAVELWSLILPYAKQSPLPFTKNDLPFLPMEVWKNAWQSPRGRDFARQIVFLEVPLVDCVRMTVHVYMTEGIRDGAFRGELSKEHDELLSKLIDDVFAAYFTGKESEGTLMIHFGALFFAWSNRFGLGLKSWEQVHAGVASTIRGPVAYLLGHRYLVLRSPKSAKFFFEAALADAPADPALHRLAQRELDRLAGNR